MHFLLNAKQINFLVKSSPYTALIGFGSALELSKYTSNHIIIYTCTSLLDFFCFSAALCVYLKVKLKVLAFKANCYIK